MAHSYISTYVHYVFSTKYRRKIITPALENRLYPYMAGIARKNKMRALAINGIEDHVHLLIALPSTITIGRGIQLIKGTSSRWVCQTFPEHSWFQWQIGYGAFSVSYYHIDKIIAYIRRQKIHHRRVGFKREYVSLLERHGMDYDEKYVWG